MNRFLLFTQTSMKEVEISKYCTIGTLDTAALNHVAFSSLVFKITIQFIQTHILEVLPLTLSFGKETASFHLLMASAK